MVEQIVQRLKLLNEERPQVILIPELENVKDSTVICEGFDLEAMEELLMWDEYRG